MTKIRLIINVVACIGIGSKSGDYEELKEKIHTKVLSNHSLLLQNVKEDKQGYYLCQASNGIGNAIGKVIQVNVKCECSQATYLLYNVSIFPLKCITS